MVAKRRDHSSNTETDDGDNGHKRWFVSVVSSNDDECSKRECYVDGGSDDAGNAEAFILQGPQVFRVLAGKLGYSVLVRYNCFSPASDSTMRGCEVSSHRFSNERLCVWRHML